MDLTIYLGKTAYINLINGYYYRGVVKDADDNSITLLDITGKIVSISKTEIGTITEVYSK